MATVEDSVDIVGIGRVGARNHSQQRGFGLVTRTSKWRLALGPLLIAAAFTAASPALADGVTCGKPCVIQYSAGGNVLGFRLQGQELAAHSTPVIVDGPCLSACTLLVDEARGNVCITDRAVFGYHQSFADRDGERSYTPLEYKTPGLDAFLENHGGEPKGVFLMVPFAQAKAFYQPCAGAS
jgi:hypothetical protein